MSGEITINRSDKRPSWNHLRVEADKFPGFENASMEMLESIRNVMESVLRSQMLQCDVACAIKSTLCEMQRLRKAIERIDRRLAKVEKLR